jgi:hypothetical protein
MVSRVSIAKCVRFFVGTRHATKYSVTK